MEEVQQPCEDSVYSPLTLPCICHGDWLITLLFPLLFRKRKGGAHDCEGDTNSLPGTVAAVNRSTWQFSHVKKGQLLNEHSLGRFLMSLLIGLLIRSFVQSPLILELCLTSNVKSQTVPSYDRHHFGFWYSVAHPAVICVRCFAPF